MGGCQGVVLRMEHQPGLYGIIAWAYKIYGGFSEKELKEKKILTDEFNLLLLPFGMMLAWIWKMKYRI